MAVITLMNPNERGLGMSKTVMIVEDEALLALDIERIVEEAGYRVAAIAADRSEALANAGKADIALVDLNLRDGLTGPAIACQLAEEHGTKIVYVTANPAQITPRAASAVGVVSKPFRDEAILHALALATSNMEAIPTAAPAEFRTFDPDE